MEIALDFSYFPTNNTKTLGIIDASHYHTSILSNPKIFIAIPGSSTASEINFKPNRINIFNSNNLCITNVTKISELIELPDGIYQIRYTGNIGSTNYEVEKSILRTERLQSKFEDTIRKIAESSCNKITDLDSIKEVEFSIMAAVTYSNNCELNKAINYYRLADKTLDKLLKSC